MIDARPFAIGSLAETFDQFPHLAHAIPAMGYTPAQVADLEATLRAMPADVVVDASPAQLARLLTLDKPIVEIGYELHERGDTLVRLIEEFERNVIASRSSAERSVGPSGVP